MTPEWTGAHPALPKPSKQQLAAFVGTHRNVRYGPKCGYRLDLPIVDSAKNSNGRWRPPWPHRGQRLSRRLLYFRVSNSSSGRSLSITWFARSPGGTAASACSRRILHGTVFRAQQRQELVDHLVRAIAGRHRSQRLSRRLLHGAVFAGPAAAGACRSPGSRDRRAEPQAAPSAAASCTCAVLQLQQRQELVDHLVGAIAGRDRGQRLSRRLLH